MNENWQGQCHCGAVQITMHEPPVETTQCNCSMCSKSGFIGTYGSPETIAVEAAPGAETAYIWGDKSISIWHCATCGTLTHWTPIAAPTDRMGVNARLFDAALWRDLPVIHVDGANY